MIRVLLSLLPVELEEKKAKVANGCYVAAVSTDDQVGLSALYVARQAVSPHLRGGMNNGGMRVE